MKPDKRRLLLGLALVLLVTSALADAQTFSLPWWTVDGGGSSSNSASYSLSGGIGQPDAGVLDSGGYILGGGFWPGRVRQSQGKDLYLPLVSR
jgi:hypothetical protein